MSRPWLDWAVRWRSTFCSTGSIADCVTPSASVIDVHWYYLLVLIESWQWSRVSFMIRLNSISRFQPVSSSAQMFGWLFLLSIRFLSLSLRADIYHDCNRYSISLELVDYFLRPLAYTLMIGRRKLVIWARSHEPRGGLELDLERQAWHKLANIDYVGLKPDKVNRSNYRIILCNGVRRRTSADFSIMSPWLVSVALGYFKLFYFLVNLCTWMSNINRDRIMFSIYHKTQPNLRSKTRSKQYPFGAQNLIIARKSFLELLRCP